MTNIASPVSCRSSCINVARPHSTTPPFQSLEDKAHACFGNFAFVPVFAGNACPSGFTFLTLIIQISKECHFLRILQLILMLSSPFLQSLPHYYVSSKHFSISEVVQFFKVVVKHTWHNIYHFDVYNSVVLKTFMMLCNHHLCPSPELLFIISK